jgi:hypothetical protein
VEVESLWDSVFVVRNLEFGDGLSRFGVSLLLALCPFLGLFRLLLLTGALFLAFIERRTRVSNGPPGSPPVTWPPHTPQNDFGRPSSGVQVRTASAPAVKRKPSEATIAFSLQSAPVRRWQRLQWQ